MYPYMQHDLWRYNDEVCPHDMCYISDRRACKVKDLCEEVILMAKTALQ